LTVSTAGLYDVWVNPKTGEELYTYTIITVPASKAVEWIHDRMPAILGKFTRKTQTSTHSLDLKNTMKQTNKQTNK
jgi:putative SOS response-associated peptidase YedK